MRRLFDRDPAVTADIWVEVVDALQGTLMLNETPNRTTRVGPYNAMDFARGLAVWARRSLGFSLLDVTPRLWEVMV